MQCKNCKTELADTCDYCFSCGARVIRNKLTFKNLAQHISETFFNYDNKLLQTFISLFKKPEDVISSYINGVRKKYVNPVSYFAIALTLIGLQMFVINKFIPEALDIGALTVKGQEEVGQKWMKRILEYQSIIFMLNVPVYALLGRLVFLKNKTYNYIGLVVVFLYTIAQMSLTLFIPQLILMGFGFMLGEISWVFLVIQIIYSAYCLKRLYNLSIKGIILKSLLFLLILSVLYVISIIIIVIVMITIYGGIEEFVEATKAMQ